MSRTFINGIDNIKDRSVRREDLDTTTPGHSVITRIIPGNNVEISYTGADEGTGEVTINALLNGNQQINVPFTFVGLKSTIKNIPTYSNYIIPFKKIIENSELTFDKNHAKFVVPKTGLYLFHLSITFNYYVYKLSLGLKINNSYKKLYYSCGYDASFSYQYVMSLTKNTSVQAYLNSSYNRNVEAQGTYLTIIQLKVG